MRWNKVRHSHFMATLLCLVIAAPALLAQQAYSSKPGNEVSVRLDGVSPQQKLDTAYRIGAGDVLHISVWHEDGLTQTVVVRPDGNITLPLISEVSVVGKTPLEVQKVLTSSFSKFVSRPEVTVTVAEANSQVVYILGEVQRPGAYPLTSSMDVLQLIARAGGLTPFAKKKSMYLMHDRSGQRTTFNYAKLISGKDQSEPLDLSTGDIVVVP